MSERIDAFKHWIPNVLLKKWNQKSINNTLKENDHLLIYSLADGDFIKDKNGKYIKCPSSKDRIPFGEKYYNNQFLENEIFCLTEKKMGTFYIELEKDNKYNLFFEHLYMFWIFLIMRNKNSIYDFKEIITKRIFQNLMSHKEKYESINITYCSYAANGEENIETIENKKITFNSKSNFIDFLLEDSEENYNFFKDLYWNQTKETFKLTDSYIPNLKEKTLVSYLFLKMLNFSHHTIHSPISELPLPDNFEFVFEVKNNKLNPISIAKELLYNDTQAIKKCENIELILIPINPSCFLTVVKDYEKIPNYLEGYLIENNLSKEAIDGFKALNTEGKLIAFYNIMSLMQSANHIILAKKNDINDILDFIKEEQPFIKKHKEKQKNNKVDKIEKIKMSKKSSVGYTTSLLDLGCCQITSLMSYKLNKLLKNKKII